MKIAYNPRTCYLFSAAPTLLLLRFAGGLRRLFFLCTKLRMSASAKLEFLSRTVLKAPRAPIMRRDLPLQPATPRWQPVVICARFLSQPTKCSARRMAPLSTSSALRLLRQLNKTMHHPCCMRRHAVCCRTRYHRWKKLIGSPLRAKTVFFERGPFTSAWAQAVLRWRQTATHVQTWHVLTCSHTLCSA